MSEQESEASVPPESEENQAVPELEENQDETRNEEHKDDALSVSEDQGQPGTETEALPGVSTSEDQGEAETKDELLPEVSTSVDQGEQGSKDELVQGVSISEDQGEARTEDETLSGISTFVDEGETGNKDEPLPVISTSENQGKPGTEDEQLPSVSTAENQGETGNDDLTEPEVNIPEAQREPGNNDEPLPAISASEDEGGQGTEEETANEIISEIKNFDDQGASGINEDQEKENLEGVKPSDGETGAVEEQVNSAGPDEQQVPEDDAQPTATIKLLLMPGGHIMTATLAIGLSVQELKHHFATELNVPAGALSLSLNGQESQDEQSLSELGIQAHSTTTMELMSSDPDTNLLFTNTDSELEDMTHVINVSLITDDGAHQNVPEETELPYMQKPFLGGYRHKLTGTEYHHASAQTPRRARPGRGVDIVSRDTQTAEQVLQAQQCPSSVTTQMTSVGCYISNLTDKLLSPGRYITADEYHEARLNAVIRLQAHTRRWLSCQAVDRLRRQRDRRLAWLDLQERRRHEEREEQQQDCHNRWMQPRKREDLNLLYNALEKWRIDKERQINQTMRGAERKVALCSLLEQETQYIATIGRHGIAIWNNNYNKTVRKFLDKSSAPHQWRGADGRMIEMDTPNTIRARELGDLYDCVAMSPVSQEQRLGILQCLKQTVEVYPCQLTQDIVELISREEDLMKRQVKVSNLEGLRKRLSTLFLQFIRTPGFNPEVAKHLKVPQSTSQLKNDVFLCHSCQRYLGSTHFRSCTRSHLSRRCQDCARLKNIAGNRDDFSCYKNMLKRLRDGELHLNKDNTIPFILQVEDIQHLVEVIWGARSALSGNSDLFSLVLVRWERDKDWSPWNCVLLCTDETDAHLQVEDIYKVYDIPVISSIEHKHLLARRYYNQIPTMVTQSAKAALIKRGTRRIP
ncbi:IQ and ubiquitin-like domain-containing protein [Corythoichthys intestinalis]|uniref:IQ and ubiquitin-like domain-containing protein n=1 Tax=Corythoichthys intestinalis TaxID=161448 RepID=UPI0025A5D24E|nr:IQ and ubiquitin-like domain-containing protein [Corythoichthys intestinalis]